MVTVISTAMRDNLRVKGVPSDKLKLIANFADSDFITPLPRANPFSDALGLGGKFVVMHAGNLGYVYDLGGLLDAASRLNQLDDLRVIIVGDGVAKAALEEQVRRRQLSNVVILPFQPREQLPWLRATADVQVSLYKRGAARHSMPSKVYEIMASGRPLIASAESDSPVGRLIAETGCGRCVEPENGEALAAAIEALYCDRKLCTRLGAQGRHHAVQNYSAAAVAAAYEKLLQELPSTSSSPSVPAPASPAGNRRWLSPKR
jgi:colanic acid biosynthesis glycosyl transferase WcaI